MKSIIIVLFVFCLIYCSCTPAAESDIKSLSIHGTVITKFKSDTSFYGGIVLRHENKIDTLINICYCVADDEHAVWNFVAPNDSLYKLPGSMVVYVNRNGTNKQFIYPVCLE